MPTALVVVVVSLFCGDPKMDFRFSSWFPYKPSPNLPGTLQKDTRSEVAPASLQLKRSVVVWEDCSQ